jgi:hypothetical protein
MVMHQELGRSSPSPVAFRRRLGGVKLIGMAVVVFVWRTQVAAGQLPAASSPVVQAPARGVLAKSATWPYRLLTQDGSLFNAVGIQNCWFARTQQGGLQQWLDDRRTAPLASVEDYFTTYAGAGFNLFRFQPGNCNDLDNWSDPTSAGYIDRLLSAAYERGFVIWFTFFNANLPCRVAECESRILQMMQRWGQYVDVWEISNESDPSRISDADLQRLVAYTRANDPYGRLIANSNPRPGDWTFLDIRSPHWYQNTTDDSETIARATADGSGVPYTNGAALVVGEAGVQGRSRQTNSLTQLRTRTWTAFLAGGGEIWWDQSAIPTCPCNNMYIGPVGRGYMQAFANLTAGLDPALTARPGQRQSVGNATLVVAQSSTTYLGYVYRNPGLGAGANTFTIPVPFAGTAQWLQPTDGTVLETFSVGEGSQTLTTPTFTDDILLRIVPS